jgi:GR25 family glycosyltransferase involved in LPS biosynthesis
MQAYVINLEKRADRLHNFNKNFETLGPRIPLTVVQAIDGSDKTMDDLRSENLAESCSRPLGAEYISRETDYENPRVMACAISHMKAWSAIIESGKPGLIFEDDVLFREDGLGHRNWPKFEQDLLDALQDSSEHRVVYIGAGDVLPIHTNIMTFSGHVQSKSLLRAQERSHVSKFINDSVGTPKTSSAYLFDWFGGFAYCISPKTAKYLFEVLEKEPMRTAVDVFVKNHLEKYVTGPLLAYHPILEMSDSDICARNRAIADK